jgi:hypothetical protein
MLSLIIESKREKWRLTSSFCQRSLFKQADKQESAEEGLSEGVWAWDTIRMSYVLAVFNV